MTTIGCLELVLPLVVAFSAAMSAAVLLLGWNRRGGVLARQAEPGFPPLLPRFELGRTPFASGLLDVTAEIRAVLGHLGPLAAQRFVQLELAVQPGLAVRADSRVLREVVADLVTNAITHTPCGRVLVGGMQHGGRVQISVTDDGNGPPDIAQDAALRGAERLIALQGGTIHVDTHAPGEGSTVVMRLPEPAATTRVAAPVVPGGGATPAPPTVEVRNSVTGLAWGR